MRFAAGRDSTMQNMVFVLLIKLVLVLLTVLGVTYMWQRLRRCC